MTKSLVPEWTYLPALGNEDASRHVNVMVTGPARSGTTMMHLLVSFCLRDSHMIWPERHCGFMRVKADTNKKWIVWKSCNESRKLCDVFSFCKNEDLDLKIVYMVRDPRDLITSKNACHKWRYVQNVNDVYSNLMFFINDLSMGDFDDDIIIVKFEELVRKPDEVQSDIFSKFGMRRNNKFSKCHKEFLKLEDPRFCSEEDGYINNLISKEGGEMVRPFDSDGVGRWRDPVHFEHIKKMLSRQGALEKMNKMLTFFGYEEDGSWVDEVLNA